MAIVEVMGRKFEVPNRQDVGGLLRRKKQIDALVKLSEAKGVEAFDLAAEYIGTLLDVKTPEDLQWLKEHLPEDTNEISRAAILAAGGKVAEPATGEAARQ